MWLGDDIKDTNNIIHNEESESHFYTSWNDYMKQHGIIYIVDSDITYDIFRTDKRITNSFVEWWRYDEVRKCIIAVLDSYSRWKWEWSFNNFFNYDDDKTVFSYILFQTLYSKENLYIIYNDVIEEVYIVSDSKLPEFIHQTIEWWRMTFISKVLSEIKFICSGSGAFKAILNKYNIANKGDESNNSGNKMDLYIKCLEDIKSVQFISEEFKNCRIKLNMKDWKPFYMEAETKTDNTDFNDWKPKLWDERRIEENAHGGRAVKLTVTKKFKYWKKEDK